MNKSVKSNSCSGGAMKALTTANCGYTKPFSGFIADNTTSCPNSTIIFTDTSTGIVKTYLWNFGKNATPATANTKGPHTVKYNVEESKQLNYLLLTILEPIQVLKIIM